MNNIIENSTVHVHISSSCEIDDAFVDFEHRSLGECFLKDASSQESLPPTPAVPPPSWREA